MAAQTNRNFESSNIDERTMREIYLPAFEAAVTQGKSGSVMCAYNRVNGQAACASDTLLGRILRNEWRFPGYVVSDCGAIRDFVFGHRVAPSPEAASAMAVKVPLTRDSICGLGLRSTRSGGWRT